MFQTDEEWSMVLLLIRLSHKPLKIGSDVSSLETCNSSPQENVTPQEDIDWKTYLNEGWEKFELPPHDSVSLTTETDSLVYYYLVRNLKVSKSVNVIYQFTEFVLIVQSIL